MALFGKKLSCPCPAWYLWLVVVVGVILALSEVTSLDLRGLTWGPVAIILIGLGCLLGKK